MIVKDRQILGAIGRSVGAGIAGVTAGISASRLRPIFAKLGNINKINIFSNVITTIYGLVTYYFGSYMPIQPSVVMGGFPMPSVSEISHAMSDRILKYRATGGIFLAHQEGGEQTLRIVGKSFGRSRYLFLTMLDLLFFYGSAQIVDLFTASPTLTGLPSFFEALFKPRVSAEVSPWIKINEPLVNEGRKEAHLTFPVITKAKIYTSMYIETYDFAESIENGMNCLTYTIFLRKYIPHFPYKYSSEFKNISHETIWYYSEDKDDEAISKLRAVDLMMEIGFSASMIMYRFFQHLAGNSIETSVSYITGINLNQQNLGVDNTSKNLSKIYTDIDYDLNTLSLSQKEELMQIG